MEKLKISALLVMLILATVSVLGTSSYTYDSNGFNVFEDWDTFNTSMWYSMLPNYGIVTEDTYTWMSCEENYTGHGSQQGGFILNNSNYHVPINSTWTVDLYYRYYNNNSPSGASNYASMGYTMTGDSTHLSSGTTDYRHNYELLYPLGAVLTFEEWNGTGVGQWSQSDVVGGVAIKGSIMRFIKTFNTDGTINIEYFLNTTDATTFQSLDNRTSVYNWTNGTMGDYLFYGVECYQSNAIVDHKWQMDWLNLTVTYAEEEAPANTAPTVNIMSPANETHTNIQSPVVFNATDAENATLSCSLYVDTVLNETNSSVANNTETTLNPVWTDGIHQWYIGCSDGQYQTNSAIRVFNFDNSTLLIQSASPSSFNSTIFTGYSMSIVGNVTNSDIGLVNRTIRYPNSTVFYHNSSGALPINTSIYSWSDTFNTTAMPNGIYSLNIYAIDNGAIHNTTASLIFEIDNCVPSWSCGGYGACQTDDTALCTSAIDLNVCGIAYTGNLSEFSPQACNYCARDIVLLNESACAAVNDTKTMCFEDNNFATCCNVTGIASDCYGDVMQTEAIACVSASCSIFSYGTNDITGAAIDVVAKGIIGIASVAFLVGLIFVGLWGYNRFKMR